MIPLSPVALFAKRMDVRHNRAGVRLMSTLKNCGKLKGTILSGWLIYRHDFSLMQWNMSALLAYSSLGLLLITLK